MENPYAERAETVVLRCQEVARLSEEPCKTTRTYLSPAMQECHSLVRGWMEGAGLSVAVDPAGNLRGYYGGRVENCPLLLIGSHLDTVPNAGAYDGVLGVILGLALIEALNGRRFAFGIELIGFSEEEGIRFGVPFIGSRALVGRINEDSLNLTDASGLTVAEAIRSFGLDPRRIGEAILDERASAYLEFHIEQGPVLESLGTPLAVVKTIAGQSRLELTFTGRANHAGTAPMDLRRDALTAAAEWILQVERVARSTEGLVATVGRASVTQGAGNVVPGEVLASLDVRHENDDARSSAVERLVKNAQEIATHRGVSLSWQVLADQPAVFMDPKLVDLADQAIRRTGVVPHRMASGAGHDAMIMAERIPSVMVFLRSPGGISHHPDESVLAEDVEKALEAGLNFVEQFEQFVGQTITQ
jgi:allantoate deiminase